MHACVPRFLSGFYPYIPRLAYVRRLFSPFKLANEEEALVDVVENGKVVTEETLSRKRKQRESKEMERRRNESFGRSIGTKCMLMGVIFKVISLKR